MCTAFVENRSDMERYDWSDSVAILTVIDGYIYATVVVYSFWPEKGHKMGPKIRWCPS